MEGNKDEALRCLSIAQKHRNAGNYTSARKFIQKSLALFTTPEAEKLAQIIESEASASTSTSTSKAKEETTKATGTEQHPSAGGTHHRHPKGNASKSGPAEGSSSGSEKKRDYTPEQLTVVKRVRACAVTEYYEILELKKECEEADVKKAYRKVCFCISLTVLGYFVLILDVWDSLRWPCTLTKMALPAQTRLSRVRSSRQLCGLSLTGLCSGIQGISSAIRFKYESGIRPTWGGSRISVQWNVVILLSRSWLPHALIRRQCLRDGD